MGTDIHAAIEYRKYTNDPWQTVKVPNRWAGEDWGDGPEPEMTSKLDIGRSYDLFAILANVRNGSGFAGVPTSTGFECISSERGLPPDISDEGRAACDGEHSATYVNMSELLAFDWTQTVTKIGVVNAVEYEEWKRLEKWHKAPKSYCGGISGPGIKFVTPEEMQRIIDKEHEETERIYGSPEHMNTLSHTIDRIKENHHRIHTRITWEMTYAECVSSFWKEIFPMMLKKYAHEQNYVRLVMNFDS